MCQIEVCDGADPAIFVSPIAERAFDWLGLALGLFLSWPLVFVAGVIRRRQKRGAREAVALRQI
jgi:hypothetical protein